MSLKLINRIALWVQRFCQEHISYHWYAFGFSNVSTSMIDVKKSNLWFTRTDEKHDLINLDDIERCRAEGGIDPDHEFVGCWYIGRMTKAKFDSFLGVEKGNV